MRRVRMAFGHAVLASIVGCLLLGLICAVLSLGAVEQNEYGLLYNWVTKTISNKVYHGGTHWIGFWNSFVVFPATVQTIEFSDRVGFRTAEALHTRTKEGLGLHLSISFQYKLDPDRIPELYTLTNIAYEGLFTRVARDQLLEAASEYEGPQYWLERKAIGDHMRLLVDQQLRESYSSLWGLQLLIIDLPDRYENSITMTQVQQQMVKTRQNQQTAASIRADTEVLRSEFARDVQVVQADAQANYTLATKLAEAEALRRKLSAEAEALGYVRKKLGLSAMGTVEYQKLTAFGALQNATLLANVPGALPVVNIGGRGPTSLIQRASDRSQGHVAEAPEDRNSLSNRSGVQDEDGAVVLPLLAKSRTRMAPSRFHNGMTRSFFK